MKKWNPPEPLRSKKQHFQNSTHGPFPIENLSPLSNTTLPFKITSSSFYHHHQLLSLFNWCVSFASELCRWSHSCALAFNSSISHWNTIHSSLHKPHPISSLPQLTLPLPLVDILGPSCAALPPTLWTFLDTSCTSVSKVQALPYPLQWVAGKINYRGEKTVGWTPVPTPQTTSHFMPPSASLYEMVRG